LTAGGSSAGIVGYFYLGNKNSIFDDKVKGRYYKPRERGGE
jgi:hypothetical protein